MLKGKQIAVEGELHQDRWEQEGQKQEVKVVIHSSNIQLLGGNDKQGAAILEADILQNKALSMYLTMKLWEENSQENIPF